MLWLHAGTVSGFFAPLAFLVAWKRTMRRYKSERDTVIRRAYPPSSPLSQNHGQLHHSCRRLCLLRRVLFVQLGHVFVDSVEPVSDGIEPVVDHVAPNEQEHSLVRYKFTNLLWP